MGSTVFLEVTHKQGYKNPQLVRFFCRPSSADTHRHTQTHTSTSPQPGCSVPSAHHNWRRRCKVLSFPWEYLSTLCNYGCSTPSCRRHCYVDSSKSVYRSVVHVDFVISVSVSDHNKCGLNKCLSSLN